MKKDRNTFFQESNYMSQTNFPNPQYNIANQPITTGSYSNQGFYAGPSIGLPIYNTTQPNQNPNLNYNYDYSDIESRISKIERQINRIDARLNKLENSSFYTTEDIESNNIYMV